jgi:hypothetical protein
MRRSVMAAILLLLATKCQAQINCPDGTRALACIIPDQLKLKQGQSQNLNFINEAIGSQVSDLPLASPASGIIYTNDPKLNTPIPSNATLGPILTQRAETIGYHKFYVAFTYQYFSFNVIDGVSLKNLPIFLPLATGLAVTATNNRLDLKANQYTGYFTFGLTSHIDVSVAVPIVSVSEQFTSSGIEYDLTNPAAPTTKFSNYSQLHSVTASGIGDLTLAAKYWLWRPEHGGVTIGAELRTPTGDAKNFLGTGTIGFRPYVTGTFGTRFSPHFNLGYEVNGDTVLVTNSNGGSGHLPNRFLFSAGVDWGIQRWITLAVDFLGQQVYDAQRIKVLPAPPITNPGVNITYPTIYPYNNTYVRGDASVGIKVRPFPSNNLIITGNALIRLNNEGLRSAVVPLVAVSYTF